MKALQMLAVVGICFWVGAAPAAATDLRINEIRITHPGSDINEYFEIHGPPGASLDGLTYLVLGDDSGDDSGDFGKRSGVIECLVDLSGLTIPSDGHLLVVSETFTLVPLEEADLVLPPGEFPPIPNTLNFENSDNVSHLLVSGFTGEFLDDLDIDNDGVLDSMPWSAMVDGISLVETENPPSEFFNEWDYGFGGGIGPDGNFVPGQVYRCDPLSDWTIGAFSPDDGTDTPGTANLGCFEVCGVPDAGDCFEANGSPGCDEGECCSIICDIDPSCCDTAWTQSCADSAAVECRECGDPETGDCFADNGSPYCNSGSCCEAVCAVDASCCEVEWNQACADQAAEVCEGPGELIISEIVDATLPGGLPKFVELTNCDSSTIDLSLYSIGNFNNGSTTLGGGAATVLSGSLAPGDVYVISYEFGDEPGVGTFFEVYGFDPDNFDLGAFINGDDVVALFFGAAVGDGTNATMVDVYGELGVDGSGEAWEYADGFSFRNLDSSPTNVFDISQWTVGGADSLQDPDGDDKVELGLILENTTPGLHECSSVISASLDIKPRRCPNGIKRGANAAVVVGLLGSEDFDASQVDLSTLALSRADGEGSAIGPQNNPRLQDVGTPFDGNMCDCHAAGKDGTTDVRAKFKTAAMEDAFGLGGMPTGTLVELTLTGTLLDGSAFAANDCIRIDR